MFPSGKASRARKLLGYIGPIIVLVGAAVAGVGVWYVQNARPIPGDVLDTIQIDAARTIVIRAERGGERSFIELQTSNEVTWQALIPHYAGEPRRPGVAWSARAVTVRVERHGRAEVFAFLISNAAKLGGLRLAPEHEPIRTQRTGPITLTDHQRAYEIVGGEDWNQVIAVDLDTGLGAWKIDLGKGVVRDGGVDHGVVWLQQDGRRRRFDANSGRELPDI